MGRRHTVVMRYELREKPVHALLSVTPDGRARLARSQVVVSVVQKLQARWRQFRSGGEGCLSSRLSHKVSESGGFSDGFWLLTLRFIGVEVNDLNVLTMANLL